MGTGGIEVAALRVSGGEHKGRKIHARGLGASGRYGDLRPTSAKVREALFDILGERVSDVVFADLYAGTGAVGFEAMSRGARLVYLVEADPKRYETIVELIKDCGCRNRAEVVKRKAEGFLSGSKKEGIVFDILFLDPPYGSDELENVLPFIGKNQEMLSEDAVVVAEHMSKFALPDEAGVLKKRKTYKYGDTSLTLYRKAS